MVCVAVRYFGVKLKSFVTYGEDGLYPEQNALDEFDTISKATTGMSYLFAFGPGAADSLHREYPDILWEIITREAYRCLGEDAL